MEINYTTLTEEQIEELVEFINWSRVPSHFITENVRRKFSPIFKGLQIRIWFEDLLSSFQIKVDRRIYPDSIFFFIEGELYMELDIKTGDLWCSYDNMWSVFESKFDCKYDKIQLFIKNVVEMYIKDMEVTPIKYNNPWNSVKEMCFQNMEVTPSMDSQLSDMEVEILFKNKKTTQNNT